MFKKVINLWAQHQVPVSIIALIIAVVFPLVAPSPYVIHIGVLCLIYTVLSLSLNLVTGFLGITTLGHAAFFGIGAYTAAILSTSCGFNFFLTMLSAGVVSALFGALLGAPTLRISGRYLTIVTIGFCEITRIVELNWMDLTRGPLGIPNIPAPTVFGIVCDTPFSKYYVILALAVLTIIFCKNMLNSRTGRAISAIKGDELAANVMGVNLMHIKVMTFTISAAIAGMAGGFYAHVMSYIDPTSFTFDQSVQIMSMTILGGLGSIPGSIVGAIALTVIPEMLRGFMELRQVLYGLVIVVMVYFRPTGLLGGFNLKHIRQRIAYAARLTGGEGRNG
mgnify:CR=1 FL=1